MKRLTISALALATLFLPFAGMSAQGCEDHGSPGDGPRHGRRHGMHQGPPGLFFGNPERMKRALGLSDVQIDGISKINWQYKKKFMEVREKMAPLRLKLRRMLMEDKVDLAQVRKSLEEAAALHVELRMLRIQQRLEIENLLTEKQKMLLRNFRMERHRKGPGHGNPGKGGDF